MEAPSVNRNAPGRAAMMRDSRLMRTVNREIRRRSETPSLTQPVAFFCACRDPACHSTFWLSAAACDLTLTDRPNFVAAGGHKPAAGWHPRGDSPTRPDEENTFPAREGSAVTHPQACLYD